MVEAVVEEEDETVDVIATVPTLADKAVVLVTKPPITPSPTLV